MSFWIVCTLTHYQVYHLQCLLQFRRQLFHFVDSFLHCKRAFFSFIRSHLLIFAFTSLAWGDRSNNSLTLLKRTRFVFFSVKTAKSLQRWLRYKDRYTNSKLLFPKKCGQPLEIHSFESGFKRYLGRAGIDKAYSPHALRNNFAKRCLMNGMDIYTLSRILGHSSVTVTENAYLDLTDRDLRHRYQNFSPIENMRP